jgi:hypothetical protein
MQPFRTCKCHGHVTRYYHLICSSYTLHGDKQVLRYLSDPFSLFGYEKLVCKTSFGLHSASSLGLNHPGPIHPHNSNLKHTDYTPPTHYKTFCHTSSSLTLPSNPCKLFIYSYIKHLPMTRRWGQWSNMKCDILFTSSALKGRQESSCSRWLIVILSGIVLRSPHTSFTCVNPNLEMRSHSFSLCDSSVM